MEVSPTASPIAPSAASEAAVAFARLAGHARIVAAGAVMALKLAIMAAVAIFWVAVADEVRYSSYAVQGGRRETDFLLFGMTMFATVFLARLLFSHARPAIAGIAGAASALAWFALFYGVDRIGVGYDILAYHVMLALVAMGLGALVGYGLYELLWRLIRRLDCPPAVGNLLPTFGRSPAGEYRAQVEEAIGQALGAYSSAIRAGRLLLLGGISTGFILLSYQWVYNLISRASASRPWRFWSEADVAIWMGFGIAGSVVASIALLPAGKRKSCIAICSGLAIAMATGALAAIMDRTPTSGVIPIVLQVMLASAAVAMPACAASQFVFGFMIRRTLPGAVARHLVRPRDCGPVSEAGDTSALHCEQCGYALEGLPTTRCEGCGLDELRCPECGHQQAKGVLHARAVHRLHRAHVAVRIVSRIMGLAAGAMMLLPWLVIGMETGSGRNLNINILYWREVVSTVLLSALAVIPLRLLLMHWPGVVASAVAALLPLAALLLGLGGGGGRTDRLGDLRFFLPGWVLGAFIAPLLWELWLRLLYGQSGLAAYRWHRTKAYQHKSMTDVAADVDGAAGAELPLRCGACEAEVSSAATQCLGCGVRSAMCAACGARRAISAVRVAFESMVVRARHETLVLLAVHSALAVGIGSLFPLIMAIEGAWRGNRWGQGLESAMASAAMASLLWSALVRVALIRRSTLPALWTVLLGQFAVCVLLPLLIESRFWVELLTGSYWIIYLTAIVAAVVGTLITPPLLELLALGCLPRRNARALMAFLRGRASMEEAARVLG